MSDAPSNEVLVERIDNVIKQLDEEKTKSRENYTKLSDRIEGNKDHMTEQFEKMDERFDALILKVEGIGKVPIWKILVALGSAGGAGGLLGGIF